ncbi:MAG: hypothetical protein HGB03_04065 [Candidatus Yonathbacteria bacterium]|nr:hypothetical protein [Candidatus Yonathbacteria bacterium]NTW47594.1 hypothetical protein [Candidatus Yonathbacteria bacterium]
MKKITGDAGNVGDVEIIDSKPISLWNRYMHAMHTCPSILWSMLGTAIVLEIIVDLYRYFHIDTLGYLAKLFLP